MSLRAILFAVLLPAVAGCGSGGASEPPVTSVDPAVSTQLQMSVGVATIAFNGGASVATGLNVVETLRQADGLSGVVYNVPQIIGPSSFDILNSTVTGDEVEFAGSDLGTNHITWSTLNQSQWTGPARGIKAATTGAFGYGFCPCNSDASPTTGTATLFQAFNLPVYGANPYGPAAELWYGGPPAFPAVDPSVAALGFQGYSLGFIDFAVKPAVGAYHLYAAVPPAYTTPANPTPSPNPNGSPTPAPGVLAAAAQLGSTAGLPELKTPTFKPDGKGGGSIEITVPASVTETIAVVRSIHGSGTGSCAAARTQFDSFYTIVSHSHGSLHLVLPPMLGPPTQSGESTQSICPQGNYTAYAAGFDYSAYEASYPKNLSQLPVISGNNGQADVTTSDVLQGMYP